MASMQLKDIRIKNLKFALEDDYNAQEKTDPVNFDIVTNGNFFKKEQLLVVELCLNIPGEKKTKNFPFTLDLIYYGLFEIKEGSDKKLINQLTDINCPAIIFPYVRETVADLTRRSGFPPLHLPVINFVKAAKNKEVINKKSGDTVGKQKKDAKIN